MINIGYHITCINDPLRHFALEALYHSITQPKPNFVTQIRALRTAYSMDRTRYNSIKKSLPYIVCANFNPLIRRTENFTYTEYFILDIDHLNDKQININDLRQRLINDKRIALLFASPSNDGLKILIRLSERCTDKGLYQIFYKRFAELFAKQYDIEQVVDRVTSDVTRACFVSYDPEAYFNPKAETVDLKQYCDADNDFLLLQSDEARQLRHEAGKKTTDNDRPKDPDIDAILKIKQTLNIGVTKKEREKKQVIVPPQLDEVMPLLTEALQQNGITVAEVINISYGKKIRVKLGVKQGEVNVFYGKRGYSVVISPRCGTNDELNLITSEILQQAL